LDLVSVVSALMLSLWHRHGLTEPPEAAAEPTVGRGL